MIYNFVGKRSVSYTSKKSGQPVEGTEYHVEYSSRNVDGLAVDKFFVSKSRDIPAPPYIPCTGDVYFNRFGQVDYIEWGK